MHDVLRTYVYATGQLHIVSSCTKGDNNKEEVPRVPVATWIYSQFMSCVSVSNDIGSGAATSYYWYAAVVLQTRQVVVVVYNPTTEGSEPHNATVGHDV